MQTLSALEIMAIKRKIITYAAYFEISCVLAMRHKVDPIMKMSNQSLIPIYIMSVLSSIIATLWHLL